MRSIRSIDGREGKDEVPGVRSWPGELGAGAGDDHHPVVAVGPDIVERLGQLAVRQKAPAQRAAIGVQGHLQDAVAPLHADRLVLGGVVFELAHRSLR